jgi:hypothetical protein
MRGEDRRSEDFCGCVRLEACIPADHPLRTIRELVDAALRELSRAFDRLYAREGRPSIRRNDRCERCCCKRFIRCARNDS